MADDATSEQDHTLAMEKGAPPGQSSATQAAAPLPVRRARGAELTGQLQGRPVRKAPPPAAVRSAPAEKDARPLPAPGGDLPQPVLPPAYVAAIFGVTFLLYLAFVPRLLLYSSPPTGDQAFYLMVTASLVQDGDLNVANNYANSDFDKFYGLAPHPPGFVGIDAPYPLSPAVAFSSARPPEEIYASHHLPGLPLLIAPAWVVGSWFGLWWPATVVFMCLIGALVSVNVFLLAYELTGRLWIGLAVWFPMAFSNPIFSYSVMIFTELTTGLLLVYALRRLAAGWGSNGWVRLLLVGVCIAYIPWLAWRTVLIVIPLLGYALVQWWRHNRAERAADDALGIEERKARARKRVLSLGWVLGPVLLSGVLIVSLHLFLFGSPLPPNRVPELGESSPFHWPWQGADELTSFVTNAFALLFDRRMGLITFAPVLLLSAVGAVVLLRSSRMSDRRLILVIAFVSLPYMAMIASFVYWNGLWCPPARYQTSFVPLMSAPLAISLYAVTRWRAWLYRGIYALLVLPGLLVTFVYLNDPRSLWPTYSMAGWIYEGVNTPFRGNLSLALGLDNALPAFSPVDSLRLPINTAWMTAVSLGLVFFSTLLATRPGSAVRPPARARRARALVGVGSWLGVFAIVWGGWFLINREYMKPRSVLTEVARWGLSTPPVQGNQIVYYQHSIYVPDFQGTALGKFDITTLTYSLLKLQGPEGAAFARPADIKVGPDGLLYLLNNGPDQNALFVLKPDGELVRRIPLDGKTPNAEGLDFAPDGTLVVADMVGGAVLRYGPEGGTPVQVLRPPNGLNNVRGLVVDKDGTIYASELSLGKIHRFSPGGEYVREYELGCQSHFMALSGDWLDITCSQSIVALNKVTGEVRATEYDKGNAPSNPRGITYAPDGTLYVLDGAMLLAYKVGR